MQSIGVASGPSPCQHGPAGPCVALPPLVVTALPQEAKRVCNSLKFNGLVGRQVSLFPFESLQLMPLLANFAVAMPVPATETSQLENGPS